MPAILAFLQNQWFKDPDGVRKIYERHPEARNDLIGRFLFMGCLTGRRLQAVFGVDLCRQIVWEEVSPLIGGVSSSAFPPDEKHIAAAVDKFQPKIILCFGKVAADGLKSFDHSKIIYGPHPAARQNPLPALRAMADQLSRELSCPN
jgi:hypothetical protein